jgi:zinc transporter 1/2/3
MVAMLAAIATLMVDTVATGYFRRTVARKAATAVVDEPPELGRCDGDPEDASDSGGHHGHVHGMSVLAPAPTTVDDELVRHRVISQVYGTPSHMHARSTIDASAVKTVHWF